MPRLPQPGGDKGTWGDVLNEYLSTAHNADGSLKDIAQSKVTGLAASLNAKADTSAIPTTPAQVGAEPAGLSAATRDSLSANFEESTLNSRSLRGRFVAVGDSITEVNSSRRNNTWGDSWATFATLASAGRLSHIYACAEGGANTDTVLNLYKTEVINEDLSHDLLIIADGTNDTNPLAQTLPNNLFMIDTELRKGARVAVCTIPPSGMPSIGAPSDFTLTALPGHSGGILAPGTYYYQIVSRGTYGASLPTIEKSVTLGSTGAIQIDWSPVGGATGYSLFGRTAGNGKERVFISGPGSSQTSPQNKYIDLGAAMSASTMPLADTTASGATSQIARQKIASVNSVKRYLGRTRGVPVIDQNRILVDSTTGRYKPNYTADQTHPIAKTQRLMGINVANSLTTMLPLDQPELCFDPFDPLSLIPTISSGQNIGTTGGLLLPNIVDGQRPNGWNWYGSTTTGSTALVADSSVAGNKYTITRTGWAGAYSELDISTGFNAGDLIYLAFKLKTSGLDAVDSGRVTVGIAAVDSTGPTHLCSMSISVDSPVTDLPGGWSVWTSEARVPAGTTKLRCQFNVSGNGVSASIAQLTIRNLTAQNLEP